MKAVATSGLDEPPGGRPSAQAPRLMLVAWGPGSPCCLLENEVMPVLVVGQRSELRGGFRSGNSDLLPNKVKAA
jgi:hypothetical protein